MKVNRKVSNAFAKLLQRPLILLYAAFALVMLTYFLEYKANGDYRLDRPFKPFLLNVALILSLECLLLSICRNFVAAIALTASAILSLACAHFFKLQFRHDPLVPSDLILFREALSVGINFIPWWILSLVSLPIIILLCVSFYLGIKKPHVRSFKKRAAILLLSVFLPLALIWNKNPHISEALRSSGIVFAIWDPKQQLFVNGFFVELLLKLRQSVPEVPADYDEKTIKLIKSTLDENTQLPDITPPPMKPAPNVIIYMMESFADPYELGIKVNQDPIPFFRSLRQSLPRGRVLTPGFGGNTSNVEFEILTGLSISNLPISTGPYHYFVNRPLPALPRIFKQHGYRTLAIHPFLRWFWSREKAFPYLGFEEFIDISKFKDTKKIGRYASDDNLVNEIIETVQQTTDGPFFIYALTMSTHGPYDAEIHPDSGILVKNDIDENKKQILQNYINLIYHADRALQKLVSYFKNEKRPTLIVALGDHFPSFGSANEDLNIKPLNVNGIESSNMQVAMWANYPINSKDEFCLPSFGLSTKILEFAEIPAPLIFRLAQHSAAQLLNAVCNESSMTSIKATEHPGTGTAFSRAHEIIQYDLLFGKQHSFKLNDNEFF